MRIFFVCQRVPYPPDRGDRIATLNEIRHLARRHEVHVFCLSDGERDRESIAALEGVVRSVTAVPLHPLAGNLRAARALIDGRPLSVAMLDEPALHAEIRSRYAELRPDLIIVYSCNMAPFADTFAASPRIMQFSDLDSLKWAQYAETARLPMRWVYRIETRRLLDYEIAAAHAYDHATVCTDIEKRDFERLIPGVPVSLVGNGVDLDYFRSQGAAKTPGTIVFTGVMDYVPNVDGVRWFCDAILPLIRRRVPGARFVICGSSPAPDVRALVERTGVVVTGRVPDVRPYLDSAEVCVVPLRIARGIQNKLLEAMAMGLPCVTTSVAWRGTTIRDGDGLVVADDAEAFADAVVRLAQDAGLRAGLGRKARAAVEADYTWDIQMGRLDRVIETVMGRPGAAR
ncbi:MAG: TIGR03087 family PEP-CTERM/XrtA system glycosyltransferase [Alphaproteobacteria bacterium]